MSAKDKIVPWLKSNWPIVALGVVAVAALPTAVFFSSSMQGKFVEGMQQKVNTDWDSVTKAKNSYYLQGVSGEKLLEKNTEFNSELTKFYAERWKDVQQQTGVVWEEGLKFNRGQHGLLIAEGVFPEPPPLEREVRTRELARAAIEHHKKILADARAGSPPDPAQLAAQLAEARASAVARIQAEKGAEPDKAEAEKIARDLVDARIARARARAAELGVYADMSVFTGIPAQVPSEAPTIAVAWEMQELGWVHSDLMRAVTRANQGQSLLGGVVKRVHKITVRPAGYDPTNPAPATYDPGEDKAPVNFARTITGRISGPGSKNRWFDVREATMDVVVSSQRLPAFIDALAATNFISLLDVEISPVDPLVDLKDGYVYGDEHVVRAVLTLETVWLREWRKDWMPPDVKKALAMVEGVTGTDNNAGGSGGGDGGGRRGATGGGRRARDGG